MNRADSQMMKGVAIILMIFCHLFIQMDNAELCHNFIYINGLPLTNILTRAASPVAFFLILGGYGLYKVWQNGDNHRWSRLVKLFIHYWTILLIFLIIGHLIYPDRYPGTLLKILSNITAFHATYNEAMWFLLPYIVLSGISPYIFTICRKYNLYQVLISSCTIYLITSYCIKKFGESYLFSHYVVYNLLLVLHLLPNFLLGAIAARFGWFEWIKFKYNKLKTQRVLACGGILICVSFACTFKAIFGYAFIIISLIYLCRIDGITRQILQRLGNQSMNMWMIHTWLSYYLFRSFFYGLKYPIIIFITVIIASYAIGKIIDLIVLPIERWLIPKCIIKAPSVL